MQRFWDGTRITRLESKDELDKELQALMRKSWDEELQALMRRRNNVNNPDEAEE